MSEVVSLEVMNTLAEEISRLREREKELADQKSEVSRELEEKEAKVIELLMSNDLTSYKAPEGLMSISFRTSVRQPQGEQVPIWIQSLVKKFGSLEAAIQAGMLTTNSMKLNSFYKEEMELARERGETDFQVAGLTEVKISPTLSFRRSR